MQLWLLIRTDDWGYDEYDSLVVRAFDEDGARAVADANRAGPWKHPEHCTVEPISEDGDPCVILSSFNAG